MEYEGRRRLAEEIRGLRAQHGFKTGIQAARVRLDLSRQQLADWIDVELAVVERLEEGLYPGPVLLRKLEAALGVPGDILTAP
jgi:ribosome-binding protein aMBF1 (putative translation factor)